MWKIKVYAKLVFNTYHHHTSTWIMDGIGIRPLYIYNNIDSFHKLMFHTFFFQTCLKNTFRFNQVLKLEEIFRSCHVKTSKLFQPENVFFFLLLFVSLVRKRILTHFSNNGVHILYSLVLIKWYALCPKRNTAKTCGVSFGVSF